MWLLLGIFSPVTRSSRRRPTLRRLFAIFLVVSGLATSGEIKEEHPPVAGSHPSSAEGSWTCWLPVGQWRLCQLISVCQTRPPRTGDTRTLLTSSPHRRAGDRAAGSPGDDRRGRYEATQTMRGEGQRREVACRVLEGVGAGVLRLEDPTAIGPGDPPRLATGLIHQHLPTGTRDVWSTESARRTQVG